MIGNKKKAQVWIETVIYTLIAFVIIGMVLAFVKPKIQEIQDKALIEQSIGIMEDLNTLILSLIQGGQGNQRLLELMLKKGVLKIDGKNEKIVFEIESRYTYSQPGEDIAHGSLIARTERMGEFNIITLTSNYNAQYDITYRGEDELKTISPASTPYKLIISHEGKDKLNETVISCPENCNVPEGYTAKCNSDTLCVYTAENPTINIDIN